MKMITWNLLRTVVLQLLAVLFLSGGVWSQTDSIYIKEPPSDLQKSLKNNLKAVSEKWIISDESKRNVEKLVRSINLEKPGESRPIRLEVYKTGAASLPVLADMAASSSEDDRRKALIAVIWIWQMPSMELPDRKIITPAVTDIFRRSFLDKSVKVRVASVRGIGSIGRRLQKDAPSAVMDILTRGLEDSDKQVAAAAHSEIEMIRLTPPQPGSDKPLNN